MKKIFSLIFPIAVLTVLFACFDASGRTSGANLSTQAASEVQNDIEQTGPPWLDVAWHYRRAVVISSGTFLPWYQVLITLNADNFPSFNLTNTDGSDVRFTHSDGTTLLNYWIEEWDSAGQLAYLWVRVPAVINGDTTVYLYYNNPNAEPVTNGLTTFDGFEDDWGDFTENRSAADNPKTLPGAPSGVESPFDWETIIGIPNVIDGTLLLETGTGIKTIPTYRYQAIGFKANYGLGGGYEWVGFINGDMGVRTMIGDLPGDVDDIYLINYLSAFNNIILEGTTDWHNAFHVYEVRWNSGRSEGDIDHGTSTASSSNQVPSTWLPVTLYSHQGSNAPLQVDWVYLRQYNNPEPTVVTGAEQGLVELEITMEDSPDPVREGETLTYELSIYNTSTINAPGVVVTDTLPLNVQLGSIDSSQGSCNPGGIIECYLGTILENSMASITVIVTPTIENGVITNTAQVASPGFELNLSDNSLEQATTVDSTPPLVNWEKPVQNGGTFITSDRWILLEASATDNDQVAWVEFIYWDHNSNGWKPIGTDDTYPYQVLLDCTELEPYQQYQTFIIGTDRAGNKSDPYNPIQRIQIEHRLSVFLPLMIK